MLLDFNYTTEPFTGDFPMPVVGPFKLLKVTRLNHLGKLAFRWIYWNLLLPGRPIPMIPTMMSLAGKRVETEVAPVAPAVSAPPRVEPPVRRAPAPKLRLEPTPLPLWPGAPASTPTPVAVAVGHYVDRPGVDSTADPATVLPDPIVPKF